MAVTVIKPMIDVNDNLETLRRCGGYYCCPKNPEGDRLGPLVGYADKYDAGDGTQKQWVGDVYFNFARAESWPHVYRYYSRILAARIRGVTNATDYVLGAPMGGLAIACLVARELECRYAFAEKKVVAVATETAREQSRLELVRHELERDALVWVIEDVTNNFSTTEQIHELISTQGATLVGIACLLNRAPEDHWGDYPVVAMEHVPTAQYRQDDPVVVADITKGNVILKPKDHWVELTEAMERAT